MAAVLLALLVLAAGQEIANRGPNALNRALGRVKAEAQAAGRDIDISAFHPAPVPPDTAETLVPRLADAGRPTYRVISRPLQVVIDYQVAAGGERGCVRLVRTVASTTVLIDTRTCAQSFKGPGLG
ncbi:MAG TPA: hypothetical protein VMD51_15505 [Mycobacterium sp.]|nr:hypothetical protein [Mycobacterium sp.]